MNFNKYRSKKRDDSFKNSPFLYGYDIKKLSKEQSLNYVKEYINEYIGEPFFGESNTSIKNKECIKNIFKYRPKNEHKDITELIDKLVPKREKQIASPTKIMEFDIHYDVTFTKEGLDKLSDNQLCANLDAMYRIKDEVAYDERSKTILGNQSTWSRRIKKFKRFLGSDKFDEINKKVIEKDYLVTTIIFGIEIEDKKITFFWRVLLVSVLSLLLFGIFAGPNKEECDQVRIQTIDRNGNYVWQNGQVCGDARQGVNDRWKVD